MTIPAATYNITVHEGAPYSEVFELRESDETTVIPLTDYASAVAEIRRRPGAEDVLADFSATVDGPAGAVTLSLTAEQTAALEGPAAYDVFLLPGPVLFLQGAIHVDRRVTVA